LPSKRTLDRTATVGHGWYLHIAFKKKLGEGGWCLERDKIANSKSKEIVILEKTYFSASFQMIA